MTPDEPPIYVYFARGATSGLVKIGYTMNVPQRLSSLRSGSAEEIWLIGVMPAPNDQIWLIDTSMGVRGWAK